MSEINLSEIVFDETIYPRSERSQTTVNRYAEALAAGEQFPPIILERGTNRLLDGVHRAKAHEAAERDAIDVEYHDIPAGVPAKLYAASLSAKHGDRVTGEDLREIAREIARENPDYDLKTIARYCGVTRQTVSKWVNDITERRREVRKVKALLLSRAGKSLRETAAILGISKDQVSSDVKDDITRQLTEDILREAVEGLPIDAEAIVEELRQEEAELPPTWRRSQAELADMVGVHRNTISNQDRRDAQVVHGDDLDEPQMPGMPARQDVADAIVTEIDETVRQHAEQRTQDNARLDAELDQVMEGTIQRFRSNYATAARRAGEITTIDPARVAEVFASNFDRDVNDLLDQLETWISAVRAARRQRSGLRLVGGGQR